MELNGEWIDWWPGSYQGVRVSYYNGKYMSELIVCNGGLELGSVNVLHVFALEG